MINVNTLSVHNFAYGTGAPAQSKMTLPVLSYYIGESILHCCATNIFWLLNAPLRMTCNDIYWELVMIRAILEASSLGLNY